MLGSVQVSWVYLSLPIRPGKLDDTENDSDPACGTEVKSDAAGCATINFHASVSNGLEL
jgi:hypothetical protein